MLARSSSRVVILPDLTRLDFAHALHIKTRKRSMNSNTVRTLRPRNSPSVPPMSPEEKKTVRLTIRTFYSVVRQSMLMCINN